MASEFGISILLPQRQRHAVDLPCSKRCRVWRWGYTNFLMYVWIDHLSELVEAEKGHRTEMSFFEASSSPAVPLLWKANTLWVHDWHSMIVDSLWPFHVCEQECFSWHEKHACINVDTMIKYLCGSVGEECLAKDSSNAAGLFCLSFDGRCNARTHYVAMFLKYASRTGCGFERVGGFLSSWE